MLCPSTLCLTDSDSEASVGCSAGNSWGGEFGEAECGRAISIPPAGTAGVSVCRRGKRLAHVPLISSSREEAARVVEARSVIDGEGRALKRADQASRWVSSSLKPGRRRGGRAGIAQRGVQCQKTAAWSDPRDDSKDTETGENWSEMTPGRLRRTMSSTDWTGVLRGPRTPRQVTTWGSEMSWRSCVVIHSSTAPCQEEMVADGRDQSGECVLKSPAIAVEILS